MRRMLKAAFGLVAARRRGERSVRSVLCLAAVVGSVGIAQPAIAQNSIGPGSSNPTTNPQNGPDKVGSGGIGSGGAGTSADYKTSLFYLLKADTKFLNTSNVDIDALLSDLSVKMQDLYQTSVKIKASGQEKVQSPSQADLITILTGELVCTRGAQASCSTKTFVPSDYAGTIYSFIAAGCEASSNPQACVQDIGQIDLACAATVAALCATPGTPGDGDLFASAMSALQVRSYTNGSMRISVSDPVAPGGGGATIDMVGAVPEPATWVMLIAGFGLVGVSIRRRPRRVTADC